MNAQVGLRVTLPGHLPRAWGAVPSQIPSLSPITPVSDEGPGGADGRTRAPQGPQAPVPHPPPVWERGRSSAEGAGG